MNRLFLCLAASLLILTCLAAAAGAAAADGQFTGSRDHPAIDYARRPTTDRIAALNQRILARDITLRFDPEQGGYMRAVLAALGLPVESQLLVFSKSSLQARFIGPKNPRAIFFDDSAAVAWIPGAPLLEAAVQDREQGTVFYGLPQLGIGTPQFLRMDETCLTCHVSYQTLGVPGIALGSVGPEPDGTVSIAPALTSDHRTPFARRWGGWYVTGTHGAARHRGNAFVRGNASDVEVGAETLNVESLADRVDLTRYPGRHSDIVALAVLNHQAHLTNLLTRVGWEVRIAAADRRKIDLDALVRPLVDYMLFVDEVPLEAPIRGGSGFDRQFTAAGPRDTKGRSLRDLDLNTRLLEYPCSYMIYGPAFEGLPQEARTAVYRRLWHVLYGREKDARYRRLSLADRRAVVEILRDTKPDLPNAFRVSVPGA